MSVLYNLVLHVVPFQSNIRVLCDQFFFSFMPKVDEIGLDLALASAIV